MWLFAGHSDVLNPVRIRKVTRFLHFFYFWIFVWITADAGDVEDAEKLYTFRLSETLVCLSEAAVLAPIYDVWNMSYYEVNCFEKNALKTGVFRTLVRFGFRGYASLKLGL